MAAGDHDRHAALAAQARPCPLHTAHLGCQPPAPLHAKQCCCAGASLLRTPAFPNADVHAKPAGSSAHTAVAFRDRFLLVFAGGSMAACFSDLHALDTHTMAWSQPPVTGATPSPRAGAAACPRPGLPPGWAAPCAHGRCAFRALTCSGLPRGASWLPSPQSVSCQRRVCRVLARLARAQPADAQRWAGHAGARLGDTWYVAGGGNNAAGCADMLALDLGGLGAALLAWAPIATTEPRSAIASEGLSLLAAPAAGALVAFGGYNGRYHNTVQVFRPGAARGAAAGHVRLASSWACCWERQDCYEFFSDCAHWASPWNADRPADERRHV